LRKNIPEPGPLNHNPSGVEYAFLRKIDLRTRNIDIRDKK